MESDRPANQAVTALAPGGRAEAALDAAARGSPDAVVVQHVPAAPMDDPNLVVLQDPESDAAAPFRVLRRQLAQDGRARYVGLLGVDRGVGTTTFAINLALALGEEAPAHVLLLETNLTSPTIAERLGFEPPECVTRQLAKVGVGQVVVAAPGRLPIHVAAIAGPSHPLRRLHLPALTRLLLVLRNAGYQVVIDGPALNGSSDGSVVAACCDVSLLVVRAGQTHRREIRAGLALLDGKSHAGAVLVDA